MANQIFDGQPNDPRSVEKWLHLDDFTPGCFDDSFISIATPHLSAPLGAADAFETWCCSALTAGQGLAPLPALVASEGSPALPGMSTTAFLTGFAVNPGLLSVADELILIFESDDGTTHYLNGYSDVPAASSLNQILGITGSTEAGIFGSPYPTWTRMTVDGTGNPSPILVFPASINDGSFPNGHLYIYPELLAPTAFAVQDLIVAGSSTTGQVICYGSRVIVLVGTLYPWPAGGGIATNENINFTDPPESSQYGDQDDVLTAEAPWGYGAWGTISVGELFLIKKNGGGLVVYGDIDAVTSVISMPGVQSTGDIVGRASPGPLGLVYCSEQRGAWVWNGGNTSQKISQQLRDSFYDATTATGMEGNNYGFDVAHWQNWILFSNNFMYDMDTGSWWQFYPGDGNGGPDTEGHTFWWWNEGRFGNQMYAGPLKFASGDDWWYRFDSEVPSAHWQWQSLPMHVVPNGSRLIDVLQVVVRGSDPSGSGGATLSVTIGSDTRTTGALTQFPTLFRLDFGAGSLGLEDIVATINGDNADNASAPILHSIDIGYKTRALKAAT